MMKKYLFFLIILVLMLLLPYSLKAGELNSTAGSCSADIQIDENICTF
jgi:hypothetical protein